MRCLIALLLSAIAFLAAACCVRNEETGMYEPEFYGDDQMNQLGDQAYRDILAKEKRSTDAAATALLQRIGSRIAAVSGRSDFQWEFNLIDSKTMNAFCLPGGKVAFYTGILGVCQDEAGIAVVMGHEVAHATRNHGNRRMSQGAIVGAASVSLAAILEARGTTPTSQNMILAAFGVGSQVGVLSYSRGHESEADRVGLMYMAAAGYDPRVSVPFWQRFSEIAGDSGTPSWLSTHPKGPDRAARLNELLPEAIALYEKAPAKYGRGEPVPERYRK